MDCERCQRMERNGSKRGVYVCEYFGLEREQERQFGPYCTHGCASRAVRLGALRSRCYTQPRYSAKQAESFARNALPISQAPRRTIAEQIRDDGIGDDVCTEVP